MSSFKGIWGNNNVMIQKLIKFYEKNKSLIEITGFVLIFTGLILNINSAGQFANTSMSHLKFFSLLTSAVLLTLLFIGFWLDVVGELLKDSNTIDLAKVKGKRDIRTITTITFFSIMLIFFIINLYLYIFLSYSRLFLFVLLLFEFYLFIINFPYKFDRGAGFLRQIYDVSIFLLFLIILPVGFYLIVFFNIGFDITKYLGVEMPW